MQERANPLLKKIDRYGGIPLVFCLSLLRKKMSPIWPIKVKKNPRFLFLKTGAVGDSILLSAIAVEIKETYPQAQITLLCTRSNYGITPLLAGIDDVFLFDLGSILGSLRKLQKNKSFDLVIDFAAWPRLNSLIAFFAPAKFRLGFKRRGQYRHYLYDKAVLHKDSLHELDNYRNLLHSIGIETRGILPALKTKELKKKFGTLLMSKAYRSSPGPTVSRNRTKNPSHAKQAGKLQALVLENRKVFIFHPFPGGTKKQFKMWPHANWEFLGTNLLMQGCSIWITGSSADQEESQKLLEKIVLNFARSIRKKPKSTGLKKQPSAASLSLEGKNRVLNLAGQLSWEETAYLLLKARALVSVNTGIMHLGAALGCRVIALNGPTAISRWGAVGKDVINFRSNYECSPCLSLGFEYACKAGGCMTRIKAEDVGKLAGLVLAKK